MKLGKNAVILAREMFLTPLTVERFASRLPAKVAVLPSGLAPG